MLLKFDSPRESDRISAAREFADLLSREPDRVARWGVVFLLLHIPFNLYLRPLLKVLQETDQPDYVRSASRILSGSNWLKYPFTPASLLRTHARVRFVLLLAADLYAAPIHKDA